ncbi:MAG: hypothetical protein ACI8Z1_003398 [Candidatus Azotimanducaceae bacterium]|jgi:hypothetical protein
MTKETPPTGIELTPLNDEFRENPYPILARLREGAPAFQDKKLGRMIYTKHDDVKTILRVPDM